mmetsp:Transcript_43788/g.94321  ORF Transcript_43788/g.94321 Transcript_43788/m.94321 type:complete len:98 (-) Transcript_43788:448-741(-)
MMIRSSTNRSSYIPLVLGSSFANGSKMTEGFAGPVLRPRTFTGEQGGKVRGPQHSSLLAVVAAAAAAAAAPRGGRPIAKTPRCLGTEVVGFLVRRAF